jgi:hypothetical protein
MMRPLRDYLELLSLTELQAELESLNQAQKRLDTKRNRVKDLIMKKMGEKQKSKDEHGR